MSANSGFVVMSPLPEAPKIEKPDPNLPFGEQLELEEENRAKGEMYAQLLENTFIAAIRKGMLDFGLPEERVLDYTDTVASSEFIKAIAMALRTIGKNIMLIADAIYKEDEPAVVEEKPKKRTRKTAKAEPKLEVVKDEAVQEAEPVPEEKKPEITFAFAVSIPQNLHPHIQIIPPTPIVVHNVE